MDGSGNPIVVEADCGVCGRFFSPGNHKLAILATQWHAQVMPPCNYVAKSVEALMNIANFSPRGSISTMVALSKIGEGGAGPGECFSSLTVRKETDRKNKWRVFLVRTIARVLFYEYIP